MQLFMRSLMLVLAAMMLAGQASAQSLRWLSRTGGYVAFGGGAGSFKVACDSTACANNAAQPSSDLVILVGRHLFARRNFRIELAGHGQNVRENDNMALLLSAAGAFYPFGSLHLRAGVANLYTSIDDSTGSYRGGGVGYTLGAGYDFHIARRYALTPYVNYAAASISRLEFRAVNTKANAPGKATALNFGIGVTFVDGDVECTSRAGQRILVTRRTTTAGTSCVREVEDRLRREGMR